VATRQAERSAAVMGELLDLYLDQPKAKRSIADDRAMITAYIRPRWQHHRVADIRVEDVEALHLDLTKAGKATRANRVLSLCSTLFNLAVKKRWRVDNSCVSISRNRENKRERYLSLEEIGRLVAVLGSWPDVRSAVAVKLLLLLGCRRGELVRAR
jgi:integrase